MSVESSGYGDGATGVPTTIPSGVTPVAPVQPAITTPAGPVVPAAAVAPPAGPPAAGTFGTIANIPTAPDGIAESTLATPAAAPVAAPAQPVVQDQIRQVAERYGVDADQLSGFSDVGNAEAAARLLLNQIASAGFQTLYGQPQAPAVLQPPAPVLPPVATPAAPAFELDEELIDPKVVAVIKSQQAQIAEAKAAAAAAQQAVAQFQSQNAAQVQQQVFDRATAAVDKVASPKYGVGQQRTVPQRLAVENLYRIADSLIAGMQARGMPVPVIETVIQQALYLDGVSQIAAPVVPPVPAPPIPAPAGLVPLGYSHQPQAAQSFRAPPTPQKTVPLEYDVDFNNAALAVLRSGR